MSKAQLTTVLLFLGVVALATAPAWWLRPTPPTQAAAVHPDEASTSRPTLPSLPVDRVLLVDRSGSFQGRESTLDAALRQAQDAAGPDERIAVVAFADRSAEWVALGPADRTALKSMAWLPQGGSNLFEGLQTARSLLQREGRPGSQPVIQVLTDRDPNTGVVDPEAFARWAQRAGDEGIQVELQVLDEPGPALRALARAGALAHPAR